MYEWFFQDSWKAAAKLRLEFGIRHSITQPYYSLWRNMIVFDPARYDPGKRVVQDPGTGNILSGDQYNGMVIPGNGWPDSAKGRIPIADSGEFNYLFRGASKEYADLHKWDFQPRFGIAYQPTRRQVIRAGAGRFMTRLGVSDSVLLGGQAPFQPVVSVANGNVDNPGGVAATRFPYQIFTEDKRYPNPEAWTWNITYQRELGFETALELSYVGRVGIHNNRLINLNQLMPGTLQKNPGVNPNYLRPYGGYAAILMAVNDARSRYDALQLGVTRRFTAGLGLGLAYTFSASYDNASFQQDLLPNSYDASNLWGRSSFDTPQHCGHQLHLQSALPEKERIAAGQDRRRMAGDRGHAVPVRHRGHRCDRRRLCRCRSGQRFPDLEQKRRIRAAAKRAQVQSGDHRPELLVPDQECGRHAYLHRARRRHLHESIQPRDHTHARLPELEYRLDEGLPHHGTPADPVSGGGLQLDQSPKLVHPGRQSEQRHIRQSYREDR
jgi:hypothetical protein